MRRLAFCVAVTMLILIAVGAPEARAQDSGWNLRLNLTWTDPSRTFIDATDEQIIKSDTNEAFGAALGTEYRFSNRWGLEFGVQAGYESDIALKLTDAEGAPLTDPLAKPTDGLRFTIVDAALNYYLASGKVDFYIGPVVGYIYYDDLQFQLDPWTTAVKVQTDGDTAFGAVMGLDIACGDAGWFFTTSLKYLAASYNAKSERDPAVEIDFDPLIARAGFGYRF